jgi:hypothetical protein
MAANNKVSATRLIFNICQRFTGTVSQNFLTLLYFSSNISPLATESQPYLLQTIADFISFLSLHTAKETQQGHDLAVSTHRSVILSVGNATTESNSAVAATLLSQNSVVSMILPSQNSAESTTSRRKYLSLFNEH